MSQAQGSRGQLIVQQEVTYKVDPAPAARRFHFVDEGLRLSRELSTTNIIRGNRNPAMPVRGNQDVAGSIKTHVQAFQLSTMLKWALGSVVTTGENPYIHTIKIGSGLPSFLIEKGFTDITQFFKYNGCKVNRMSVNVSPEGFQDISFDVMGAKESTSGVTFHAAPTDAGYVPFDGFSIAVIEEGGAAIANVVSADFSLENNLDGNTYVIGGAGERAFLPEGIVKVSGNIKALFQNLTLYSKAVANTESSLKIIYRRGTGAGTTGNEEIEFFIPELVYAPSAPVITGPQGVLVELPFEAYYNDGAQVSTLQIVIKNTEVTI